MPQISEQSEKAIKGFLVQWWADLTWKAHETVAGAQLPIQTPDQLYDQLLGLTLRDIAAAAEGLLSNDEDAKGETYEACQQLAEWMWARPGMPSAYSIPWEEWTQTPVGNMVAMALAWSGGEQVITVTEAASISGRSLQGISEMIQKGKLRGYYDPGEANPQRRTRVLRSEVETLPAKKQYKRRA